jgi:hypothetical protein
LQNNTVHRIGPGPVLQCRPQSDTDNPASSDRAPRDSASSRRCSDRAVPTSPARLRYQCHVSLLLHVSPHAIGHVALARHALELASLPIPPLLYLAHSRTPATESTAAPLRSVTPHPKPTTALPTDPSNSTTDCSSGWSPTTPLHPSCRERPHAHRCLQSSSIPATTP